MHPFSSRSNGAPSVQQSENAAQLRIALDEPASSRARPAGEFSVNREGSHGKGFHEINWILRTLDEMMTNLV